MAPGTSLSTAEKLALFRRLFRGRTDIYPVRREGKTSGKSGLRQRVAVRCLREAAHQMRRLQPPAAGAAVGFGDLRPPGRKQTVGVYSCSPATSLASHRRWKFGHLAGPPSESSVDAADRSMPWGSTHASNSAGQPARAGVERQESAAAEVRGARGEQTVGEVGFRVLRPDVGRLFHRGRVFELHVGAFQQRGEGARDAGLVELVAAAQHPFGFEQGARSAFMWLSDLSGGDDRPHVPRGALKKPGRSRVSIWRHRFRAPGCLPPASPSDLA